MCYLDTPRVSVSLGGGLRSGEIHEGRDVYLECDIKANPLVHEILWHFNGTTELHTDKDKGLLTATNTIKSIDCNFKSLFLLVGPFFLSLTHFVLTQATTRIMVTTARQVWRAGVSIVW